MSRLSSEWKQAVLFAGAVALLLASLAPRVSAEPPADGRSASHVPEEVATASGVFASLSAYLKDRGTLAGPEAGLVPRIQRADLFLPWSPPPQAALRVTSCRWDALQQELQCYLRCSAAPACRPFVAMIHPRKTEAVAALRTLALGEPSSRNPVLGGLPRKVAPEALLVKTGERARLELAGPGIRIKLPVVCLERGILGQQVRARAVGETKVFLARVIGPGLLATEFQ
jgi:hypothetical protein